jgi:hypothetical protein
MSQVSADSNVSLDVCDVDARVGKAEVQLPY